MGIPYFSLIIKTENSDIQWGNIYLIYTNWGDIYNSYFFCDIHRYYTDIEDLMYDIHRYRGDIA